MSGETDDTHLEKLHRVLQRFQECRLKLNPDRFHLMLHEVVYQGTTISAAEIAFAMLSIM